MKRLFLSFIPLFLLSNILFASSLPDSIRKANINAPDSVQIRAFTDMAYTLVFSDPDMAMKLAEEALTIAKGSKWRYGLGVCYNFKTTAYINLGLADSAIVYADKTYAIMKELKNKRGMFVATANRSQALVALGKRVEAIAAYQEILREAEKNQDSMVMGQIYTNIAIVYHKTGDKKTALEFYKRSVKVLTGSPDKRGLANAQSNIGVIHMEAADRKTAMEYFLKAEQIFTELKDIRALGMVYNNIGKIHYDTKNYDEALKFFEKACEYKLAVKDQLSLLKTTSNIAIIYRDKGETKKAIEKFNETIELAKKLGSLEDLKINYYNISTCYADLKDFESAFRYHCLFSDYNDSLMNAEKQSAMEEMKAKYQSEKKEQEIKLLEKEKLLTAFEVTRQKNFRNSLAGGILLTLALGGVAFNAYRQKKKANSILSEKNFIIEIHKNQLEVKNTEITDSINYAKRIQKALLPSRQYLQTHLPEHFILYKPKDIVSGDFYWVFVNERENEKEIWIAVADCTGHGVPGAFMSMIGVSLLNEIMNEKAPRNPAAALDLLRDAIIKSLNREGSEEEGNDGMDISLLKLTLTSKQARYQFAGAFNPAIIVSPEGAIELKADKMPVGKHTTHDPFNFEEGIIEKGSMIYLFTDGYADQFGGPNGKKFKYSKFRELLISVASEDPEKQAELIAQAFNAWKGELDQVDDVCVAGVRV